MSLLAQTVRLAFQIALVWAGGFVVATVVRAVLPDGAGITLPTDNELFVPYSRMGFWTCLVAAVIVTALVVLRAMLADLGLRPAN